MRLAAAGFGDISEEKASMLYNLGKTVYYLGSFEEALTISTEILYIYETIYGSEDIKTANALGNVASVSRRLNDLDNCHRSMYRALNIFINIADKVRNDENDKTVMRHRAQMYQFDMHDWETSTGIGYEEYSKYKSSIGQESVKSNVDRYEHDVEEEEEEL